MDVGEIVTSNEPLTIKVAMISTEVSASSTVGSPSPVVSNLTVVLQKVAQSTKSILCHVFDSDGKELIEFELLRESSSESVLTVVLMDGFGLAYADSASLITDRLIIVALTDGSPGATANSQYHTQITGMWPYHQTGSEGAMNIQVGFTSKSLTAVSMNFVVQNYQILQGTFDYSKLEYYAV